MDKLFLLDAYALIYRAYYAFIKSPRINSKGFNLTKDKLLFPIPVNAIDINPGLLQNPGY